MSIALRTAVAVFLLGLLARAQAPSVAAPPATPRRPITDEYHHTKVVDEYQWLENWDDPAVRQWSAAQNARTHEYLDRLQTKMNQVGDGISETFFAARGAPPVREKARGRTAAAPFVV